MFFIIIEEFQNFINIIFLLNFLQWIYKSLRYEGEYIEGFKHGKGHLIFPDSSSYEGVFHMNDIQGFGVYK